MPPQQPGHDPYEFILNPQPASKRNPLTGGSMLTRVAVLGVGLVVLLFLFVIVRGALTGDGNSTTAMVGVAQRQQEISRLSSAANRQLGISADNKSVAVTTQVSVKSAQTELLAYLKTQGQEVNIKQLVLKRSTATDEQLKAALAATTYNSVLPQVLKEQLTLYEKELQRAYQKTSGANGRKLLDKQYNGAQLLIEKLNATLPSGA